MNYQWSRIAGPVSISIMSSSAKTTAVTSILKGRIDLGVYVFELKVTNNKGVSSSARVTVVVNRKTINVSDISQLYKEVNDSANAGFSAADKTWLQVHTNFTEVNVEKEKNNES